MKWMYVALPFARIILFAIVSLSITAPSYAQALTIAGRVVDADGNPVPDARVTLVELRRVTNVDAAGNFQFASLSPGHYHLQAESARFGSALAEAEITAESARPIEITIDPAIHSEEIVVSASGDSRRASEVYQPVNVINEEELQERIQPTIGETLNREPGVNSTYFGPGSSRPVIRGLGADRIRILQEGVGTSDASNVSPDHAVSVDPANAQQIEILRGPATLLYGSNAVGGVVNVIDNRIPSALPGALVTGNVDLRAGTVADERNASINLDGGTGKVGWHLDLLDRQTGDYEIPGPAEVTHEGEGPDVDHEHSGFLENSSLETRSGTAGVSYIGSRGFIGLSINRFDTLYGVPGHGHEAEAGAGRRSSLEEEEEELVRIDLQQQRYDVKGQLNDLTGPFKNVRLRIGMSDYEHVELEGSEVGTRFTNEGLEGRLEATHRDIGPIRGSAGLQYTTSDFAAMGEEAFVPPNQTKSMAAFGFEEVTVGRWNFQVGARYENQDVSTTADLPSRSFSGVSGSAGTIWRASEAYAVAFSLARAVRLPTATELYSNGPHIATSSFEIGNVDLDEETSLGIDLSFRKSAGRVRGELNFFQNYFEGFIYDAPTGAVEDDLPVFQYVQRDARFRGVEIDTHTELWHSGDSHLEFELGADYVRASLESGEEGNLPRIPPLRLSTGLRYERGPINLSGELRHYFEQDHLAAFETETDAYTMLNATAGYRFFYGDTVHDLMLRGTNLTDELARNHVSPLKDRVPLPGRDISLAYRLTF